MTETEMVASWLLHETRLELDHMAEWLESVRLWQKAANEEAAQAIERAADRSCAEQLDAARYAAHLRRQALISVAVGAARMQRKVERLQALL